MQNSIKQNNYIEENKNNHQSNQKKVSTKNDTNFYYEQKKLKSYFQKQNTQINKENYQEIFIKEINTLRKKYNISNQYTDRWNDLVEETFFTKPYKMIDLFMDNFGFIPEEFYTKVIFLLKNNFGLSAKFFNTLKNKEENLKKKGFKENKAKIDELRNTRNIFLKYIFLDKSGKKGKIIKGICSQVQNPKENQISLDTNGVWIKLFKNGNNISSHYPFNKVDEELLNYWLKNKWINKTIFLEIKNRKLQSTNNIQELKEVEKQQISFISLKFGINKDLNTKEQIIQISNKLTTSTQNYVDKIIDSQIIIPDIIFNNILKNNSKENAIYMLFNIAEHINIKLNKENLNLSNKDYSLVYNSKNKLNKRKSKANNDTRLYSAYKAINKALSIGLPKNGIDNGFYIFSGEKDKQNNLSFIEIKCIIYI